MPAATNILHTEIYTDEAVFWLKKSMNNKCGFRERSQTSEAEQTVTRKNHGPKCPFEAMLLGTVR